MRILVLDDDDERHDSFAYYLRQHEVKHTRTVDEIVTELEASLPYDIVFLDHDLNMYKYKSVLNMRDTKVELTGADVANFIARDLPTAKRPKYIVVHSWNPPGAQRMMDILRDAGIPVTQWIFRSDQSPLRET